MDTQHTIHWKSIIIVTTSVLVIAGSILWWYMSNQHLVDDFDSCLVAGGDVQESFPRRCVYGQKTYVEEIETQDDNASRDTQIMMVIAEERGPCSDNQADLCLYADGKSVNKPIEGFEYQEGNTYKIIVDKIVNENNIRNPFTYKLNKVVSVTHVFDSTNQVASTQQRIYKEEPTPKKIAEPVAEFKPRVVSTREVEVAPYLVDCQSDTGTPCYLIDNEPFEHDIVGFDYQSGISYTIELETVQNYAEDEAGERDDPLYTYRLRSIIKPQETDLASTTATTTASSSADATRPAIKVQEG